MDRKQQNKQINRINKEKEEDALFKISVIVQYCAKFVINNYY